MTRILSLKEYWEANALALQNGSARQRRNYALTVRYSPFIGALFVIGALAYCKISHGLDLVGMILMLIGIYYGAQRWMLKAKIRKSFAAQQLDLPWSVEVGEEGVRCKLPGLSDTQLSWKYFTTCAESSELFLVINANRMSFISMAKRDLSPAGLAEMQEIVRRNIANVVRVS